mgnify:CR=1 FL=1
MILTIGDSFTYGSELEDRKQAWPYLLGEEVVNLAVPGASNDYIFRTTIDYLQTNVVDQVIVVWTTPDRYEHNGKQHTPNSNPKVFYDWDSYWARSKYNAQVLALDAYLKMPHYFCTTWDEPINLPCYIGRLVEWSYGTPKGSGGHPLEQGHQRIADAIQPHI